jgi:hypothetical protein
VKDVKIDPEFRALVFPLTEAELTGLEESLLAEGCRDALVTWRGFLLDGHHRLEICRATAKTDTVTVFGQYQTMNPLRSKDRERKPDE